MSWNNAVYEPPNVNEHGVSDEYEVLLVGLEYPDRPVYFYEYKIVKGRFYKILTLGVEDQFWSVEGYEVWNQKEDKEVRPIVTHWRFINE